MTKEKIKKLKDARKIMDKHLKRSWKNERERTQSTINTTNDLEQLGFSSIQEFGAWNDACNYEEYKRCTPIEGSCNGCAGLPAPKCVEQYGNSVACFAERPAVANEKIYKFAYQIFKRKTATTYNSKTTINCPNDGGFYVDEAKRLTPDFDIGWEF